MSVTILKGDCREVLRELPAESVHCVVTSPPYWGLRDYGVPPSIWGGDEDCEHEWGATVIERATNHTDKRRWQHTRNGRDEEQPTHTRVGWLRMDIPQGQFCQRCGAWAGAHGLEPDYTLFVAHEVLIFREVRRVLRADGTLWLNLGDSYATGAGNRGVHTAEHSGKAAYRIEQMGPMTQPNRMPQLGLKPKDLCGIPWRVAFALQADGWYLRQDIIWSKPNPMPESVRDRCTKAHEYLFLLSKSERYYYDADAIAETPIYIGLANQDESGFKDPRSFNGKHKDGYRTSGNYEKTRKVELAKGFRGGSYVGGKPGPRDAVGNTYAPEDFKRNKRSVWEVATAPFAEAHFATFPPALIEPCILAGCPEKCCAKCGAPWVREVERTVMVIDRSERTHEKGRTRSSGTMIEPPRSITLGFSPSCTCNAGISSGVCLDPFGGAGTTGLVADRLGRNAILIELNPEYAAMAERRIKNDAGMFADVAT